MNARRWARLQHLFQGAGALPPAEQPGFLARECPDDPVLRGEVEALLAAGHAGGDFLEASALPMVGRLLGESSRARQAGESIGPYRLTELIGRGGMGEVWRARDVRLARDVALKFCDARFTERFAGEARAIAALNHPNICQLYDVGPDYLVMEFVDGAAPVGPTSVAAALGLARQLADALDAAHSRGIVHRDLKPANISITPDGTLKVLDFGIATSGDGLNADGGAPDDLVIGTPAWMSPEQLRGASVDKRCDIWAFGLLVHQLVTGVNPFERTAVVDTQQAVLNAEPDWDALPVQVRRLVRRCLAKDVKQRLRDIGDAWELLERPEPRPSRTARASRVAIPVLLAAVVALGLFAVGAPTRPRDGPEPPPMRLQMALDPQLPLDLSGAANLVVSPDGSRLAFVSRGRLLLRSLVDGSSKQVGTIEGVQSPFFSPDGRSIAFFAQGQLRTVGIDGDDVRDLSPTSAHFAGGAWGPDGTIVAALAPAGPLQAVPASGGPARALTVLDRQRGETTHRLPQFLPGGKAILFTVHRAITGFDDASIDVVTLADGRRKRLIHGGTFGRYVGSGHLLYVSRGVLFAVPFDAERLEVRGDPVRVADDVAYSLYGAAQVDTNHFGTVVYVTGGSSTNQVTLDRFDRRARRRPLLSTPGTYLNPRVSPDGGRVLMSVRNSSELALLAFDVRRDALQQLVQYTSGQTSPWAPFAVWTPDGRYVVLRGDGGMFWVKTDQPGTPRRLTTSRGSQTPASFSPDGRTLAFYEGRGLVGPSDVWTVDVGREEDSLVAGESKPFVATADDESHPSFSRDGRWVAYATVTAGTPEVYVKAWPGDGRTWQVSSGGGSQPLFSRARNELYFLHPDRHVMSVRYEERGRAFVADRTQRWSDTPVAEVGATFWSFDVLPDGDGVVGLVSLGGEQRSNSQEVVVLVNAFEHLRRLAPPR